MTFVFGYGSLVNRRSRGPYLREWPVVYIAPFRRAWNAWCKSGDIKYTALGLEPSQEMHKTTGVVFEVNDARYAELLQREVGYYVHLAKPTDFEGLELSPEFISVFVTCDPRRPTIEYPQNAQYTKTCEEGFRIMNMEFTVSME